MDKIKIGQITGAVGLKGEVKVYDYGEDIHRYADFDYLYIDDEKWEINAVRNQKNMAIISFERIKDRNEAEKMRGKDVFITEDQLPELPKGTYYIKDLIGFDVVCEDGKKVGILKNIMKNTAQPLYEVETEKNKNVYIPGVDEFILSTDIVNRKITVRIIEGLLEL